MNDIKQVTVYSWLEAADLISHAFHCGASILVHPSKSWQENINSRRVNLETERFTVTCDNTFPFPFQVQIEGKKYESPNGKDWFVK